MDDQHTPLPWKIDHQFPHIIHADNKDVANFSIGGRPVLEREANAELAILAVNNHHELIEALSTLFRGVTTQSDGATQIGLNKAVAVLNKVRGQI